MHIDIVNTYLNMEVVSSDVRSAASTMMVSYNFVCTAQTFKIKLTQIKTRINSYFGYILKMEKIYHIK